MRVAQFLVLLQSHVESTEPGAAVAPCTGSFSSARSWQMVSSDGVSREVSRGRQMWLAEMRFFTQGCGAGFP